MKKYHHGYPIAIWTGYNIENGDIVHKVAGGNYAVVATKCGKMWYTVGEPTTKKVNCPKCLEAK
jgi:hypothetical protein